MQQWNGGRPDFEGTHRPFPSEDQQKVNALSMIKLVREMKKEKALWFRSFWFEEQTAKIRMQVDKKS
jgi:hypothetical protein